MTTSFYFQNHSNFGEQDLIESLMVESIRIYGHDVFYCPRTYLTRDKIYGEAPLSEYNSHYDVDVYIRSYDSFEGDGTFLSKFNLEIRDQTTFTIARRTFNNEIGTQAGLERPREGDLIYSQMMKRLFIIKYVNPTPIFYQMGALQVYDLVCEMFEYSSEKLNTGVPEIDAIEAKFSLNLNNQGVTTDDDFNILDNTSTTLVLGQVTFEEQNQDVYADNDEIREAADTLVDWDPSNPFSEDI